jgi:hypothetical protein
MYVFLALVTMNYANEYRAEEGIGYYCWNWILLLEAATWNLELE